MFRQLNKEEAIFGIVKIFEVALINLNRIEIIWDNVILNELGSITAWKQEEGKSKYLNSEWLTQVLIEAIWIIIEEIFEKQIKNEQIKIEMDLEEAYEQKDDLEIWTFLSDSWISKIFEPLEMQMKSDLYKNKLIIWSTIGNILRKHGNYLNNEIWNKVLIIILMAAKTDNSDCVQNSFKLCKLIISDYIIRMSQSNIILIIDTIYELADNQSNSISNRITAAGMFWNIAEQISKNFKSSFANSFQADDYDNSNSNNSMNIGSISNMIVDHNALWKWIFERLHALGTCSQVEVTKHVLINLENIFMKLGTSISSRIWLHVLQEIVLDIFRSNVRYWKMNKDMHWDEEGEGPQNCWLILIRIIMRWSSKFKINFSEESTWESDERDLFDVWEIAQEEII